MHVQPWIMPDERGVQLSERQTELHDLETNFSLIGKCSPEVAASMRERLEGCLSGLTTSNITDLSRYIKTMAEILESANLPSSRD